VKTRDKIYCLLAKSEAVLSGEAISRELEISRVSVWKHIRALVDGGIPIAATTRGYVLEPDGDCLNPLCFGDRKELVHYHREIGSTMDEAARLAREGCPDYTVVVAERQRSGRGRMAREWVSDDGGLYFTVVVRPELPIDQAHLTNLAAAVELSGLLNDTYGIDARLKWPNDILVDGKKLCGCLSQMEIEGDLIGFLSIGVGLNVNNDPTSRESNAVSMMELLGKPVPRRPLLTGFIDRFELRMERLDPSVLIDDWKRQNNTLGREVRVITRNKTNAGVAVDIDGQGGLVIEDGEGSRETVIYGDCFYN